MATGQSFFATREQDTLNLWNRAATVTVPGALWVALIGVPQWQKTTAYTTASYVCSTTTTNCRIFRGAGSFTSGSSLPAFDSATDGQASITDSTSSWTEQTMILEAQADNAALFQELTGNAYARLSIGLTAFGAAAAIGGTTTGSKSILAADQKFAACTTANWNPVLYVVTCDANSTSTVRYLEYSRLASQAQINIGQQFDLNGTTTTITLD